MLNTPLFETLRLLDENQWQQLERFVHSRFFAHPDNASGVVALFEVLKKHAPKLDQPEFLTKARIAAELGQSEQYVAKVGSGLHAVVRRFLGWAYQIEQNQAFQEQLGLLRFYHEKDLPLRFKSMAEKLQEQLNQQEHPTDTEHLLRQFQLNARKAEWMQDYQPTQDINLLQTLQHFDNYYLLQKAQIVFNLILRNQNATFSSVDHKPFLEYVKHSLQGQSPSNPLIQLYYEAILLLLEHNDANFVQFRNLLQHSQGSLGQYDYVSLSSLERQVILKKFNSGEIHLLNEVFKLYKRHLEQGLVQVEEGKLSAISFANIVRYACRSGELSWVETFLKQYQAEQIIGINNPQDLYRLYYAYFLIAKGELEQAEQNLSLDFEDSIRKVDARCFELIILHLQKSPLLEHKIESFRKLVRNTSSLPEIRREGFHNFALTLRKLGNPDLKRNDKRIAKIIAEVQSSPTSESFWLIEQLNLLKTKQSAVGFR